MAKIKGASWDAVFLAAVKIVTTLTAILTTKILSTGLSLNDYGTYAQASVIASLSTSFLLLGLPDAINFFYNGSAGEGSKINKSGIINTIFAIELIAGTILIVLIFLGRFVIAEFFSNDTLAALIGIVACKPVLDNLLYFYQVLFVSIGKARIIAVRNLLLSLCKLILIAIAVFLFDSISIIFVFLIILDLMQLLLFGGMFTKRGFLIRPFRANFQYAKKILVYSIPMGIFIITVSLTRDIDKLVIGYLSNTETVAIYTNCSKLLPFDLIATSFATVLIPYIMRYVSSGDGEKAVALFKHYLKIGYYSIWTLGAAVLLVCDQAICFLYSKDFLPGRCVFIIYIFDSMLKLGSIHLILTASGNARYLMACSVVSLGANTILNILLYRMIGINGPAIATLIVTLVYTIAILQKSSKALSVKITDIFDFSDLICFVIQLVLVGGVVEKINRCLLQIGINHYVAMVVTVVVFCTIILLANGKKIIMLLKEVNTMKI